MRTENWYQFPLFDWEEKLEERDNQLYEFTITSILNKNHFFFTIFNVTWIFFIAIWIAKYHIASIRIYKNRIQIHYRLPVVYWIMYCDFFFFILNPLYFHKQYWGKNEIDFFHIWYEKKKQGLKLLLSYQICMKFIFRHQSLKSSFFTLNYWKFHFFPFNLKNIFFVPELFPKVIFSTLSFKRSVMPCM